MAEEPSHDVELFGFLALSNLDAKPIPCKWFISRPLPRRTIIDAYSVFAEELDGLVMEELGRPADKRVLFIHVRIEGSKLKWKSFVYPFRHLLELFLVQILDLRR